MTTHPKPARVDLGDGDSLILFRTSDHHTTVRFHSANPNTQLAGAVMETSALHAALDEVAPAGSYTRTDEEGETDSEWWQNEAATQQERAIKAEQERDEALEDLRLTDSIVADLRAEQPRPLAPDDISDAMVERANAALVERAGGQYYAATIEAVLRAALIEPTRPEVAEELAEVLRAFPGELAGIENISNHLAEHGVRVTGAES